MSLGLLRRKNARLLVPALALATLGISIRAAAQEPVDQVFRAVLTALSNGRYLEAADMLRPLAIDADDKILDRRALQLWNQVQVDITGEPYVPPDSSPREADSAIAQRLSAATVEPAIATIVQRARKTRIVMLNEDHMHPRQRAFALQVARALRPLGYNVLALEALSNRGDSTGRTSALKRRGYVVLSDGFYTRDPVFADFIRQALQLGYVPASYEDVAKHEASGDRTSAREQGQADNLFAIIRNHPNAKLLIYVGQSHLAEKPLSYRDDKLTWMAARLAKLTGIDPLTVDQATLESGCDICARIAGPSAEAVAFVRASKPIVVGQYEGAVDLQVFKPQQRRVAGRPGWLLKMGRTAVRVPRNLLPSRGRRLVQAFVASEPDNAIPIDQFVVTAGKAPAEFMLPDAKVRFAFQEP